MFEYIGLTLEQINKLESNKPSALIQAGLMITLANRKGLIDESEALSQMHNIMRALATVVSKL